MHTWTARHPLGGLPLLGSYFDRGPFGVPGSNTTVGVFTGHRFVDGSVQVGHGASMRWIADTDDPDRSLAILPVGQSGHPFDRHYDDQLEPYLNGEARPVRWSEAAIEESAVSTLTLVP
jgi:penicillin amidase